MNAKYKIMSLFSGAGGLDLGFSMHGGFETGFSTEILRAPAKTFAENFGTEYTEENSQFSFNRNISLRGNIENIDFNGAYGKFDLVIGGPPCQDFSVLRGKDSRKGIEVRRGKLYMQFVRALRQADPKAFVFENVPGLVTANSGAAYKTIFKDFTESGYDLVFSQIVDFSSLGVPEIRRRLIIIGIRRDISSEISPFHFLSLAPKTVWEKYPTVPMEVFEGKTLDCLTKEYAEVLNGYTKAGGEMPQAYMEWKNSFLGNLSMNPVSDYAKLNGIKNFSQGKFKKAMDRHREILSTLDYYGKPVEESEYKDGSNRIPKESRTVTERMNRIPFGGNYQYVKDTEWCISGLMSNIYRRISPLQPSPTVIAYGGGGTWSYHYKIERSRLTNRERARIQTFPDWFMFSGSEQEIRAQVGEAVPPLGAMKIAESVYSALRVAEGAEVRQDAHIF